MTAGTAHRRWVFWAAFAAVTLVMAGFVSYFASTQPDGLDSATAQGCEVTDGAELVGDCIAQHATDSPMAASPLAGYTVGGNHLTGGLAGIIGVVVTLALAGGAFWLIGRGRRATPPANR